MKILGSLLILFVFASVCHSQVNRSFFDGWQGVAEDISLAQEEEFQHRRKVLRASQLIEETSLEYYPNPALERLIVKPKFEGPYDLMIRTSEGLRIWGNDNLRGVAEIDLSKLTPGMYLLDYRSQSKRIVELFLKR